MERANDCMTYGECRSPDFALKSFVQSMSWSSQRRQAGTPYSASSRYGMHLAVELPTSQRIGKRSSRSGIKATSGITALDDPLFGRS
jgi:hypothetical protein